MEQLIFGHIRLAAMVVVTLCMAALPAELTMVVEPPGFFPVAVSDDGNALVGNAPKVQGGREMWRGYLWKSSEVRTLEPLPGHNESRVVGISGEGRIAVGQSSNSSVGDFGVQLDQQEACMWPGSAGPVRIVTLGKGQMSTATAISANGQTIVGNCGPRGIIGELLDETLWYGIVKPIAFRWTAEDGAQKLPIRPRAVSSRATAVSTNGVVILATNSGVYRWTRKEGLSAIPLTNGIVEVTDLIVSADGSTIVGHGKRTVGSPRELVAWTRDDGWHVLGRFGAGVTVVTGLSANGRIIVGHSHDRSFLWEAPHGFRDLQGLLETHGELHRLGNWKPFTVTAISADGNYVIGYGSRAQEGHAAWRIFRGRRSDSDGD